MAPGVCQEGTLSFDCGSLPYSGRESVGLSGSGQQDCAWGRVDLIWEAALLQQLNRQKVLQMQALKWTWLLGNDFFPMSYFYFLTALLKYKLRIIQLTHFKCTIQLFLVNSQSCTTTTAI